MSVVSVYVVFASAEEARRVARQMVEEKLAACANVLGEVTSFYRWNGVVEEAREYAAILKTSGDVVDRLMVRLTALHSHDVPCITISPVDRANGDYAQWVETSVD